MWSSLYAGGFTQKFICNKSLLRTNAPIAHQQSVESAVKILSVAMTATCPKMSSKKLLVWKYLATVELLKILMIICLANEYKQNAKRFCLCEILIYILPLRYTDKIIGWVTLQWHQLDSHDIAQDFVTDFIWRTALNPGKSKVLKPNKSFFGNEDYFTHTTNQPQQKHFQWAIAQICDTSAHVVWIKYLN